MKNLVEGHPIHRFLVPPFLFIFSLLYGWALSGWVEKDKVIEVLSNNPVVVTIVPLIAGGGIIIIAIGFLFTAFSRNVMRVIGEDFNAYANPDAFEKMTEMLKLSELGEKQDKMFVDAAFHWTQLPETLRSWVWRRWDTALLCLNCLSALFWAHIIGHFCLFGLNFWWLILDAGLFYLLITYMMRERWCAGEMLKLAARMPPIKSVTKESQNSGNATP